MVFRACCCDVSDEEKRFCDELLEKIKVAADEQEIFNILEDEENYACDMPEEQLAYLFTTIEESGIWSDEDQAGDNAYSALELLKDRIESSFGGYCILPER